MNNFLAIYKRELKSYFYSPIAYVFIIIFLLATSGCTFFLSRFFDANEASLKGFFNWHIWLYLFLIPAIGMRLWSEERKSGTIELLFTMPVTILQATLAKFFSAWTFIGIALFLTFPLIFTVLYLGNPDFNVIIVSYFGSFLMAGAFLSITSLTSAVSKNQVISFVISVVACFILILMGLGVFTSFLGSFLPLKIAEAISTFSFFNHSQSFWQGLLDSRDILYFLSIIFFMLFVNCQVLQEKKAE